VVTASGKRPLAGAQVRIAGAEARANERGEWTLPDAPNGTRMLEVRAVGFYPERRVVDVVAGLGPIPVELSTMKAVLDTVRVTAPRLRDRVRAGFDQRVRTGLGRYMTAAEIARRPAVYASDLFRTMPGLRLGSASDTLQSDMVTLIAPDDVKTSERRVLMRGIAGDWCAPSIYLDGALVDRLTADDIDAWVRPGDIAGIEVYTEATVPAQYQRGRRGCGSILIWRK
jgi:hypothetical protein